MDIEPDVDGLAEVFDLGWLAGLHDSRDRRASSGVPMMYG